MALGWFRDKKTLIQKNGPVGAPRAAAPDAPGPVPWPRFPSRFGGMWVDLSNAHQVVDGKLELGHATAEEARLLHAFIDDGYVILPKAVPVALLDDLEKDIVRAKQGAFESVYVEHWGERGLEMTRSTPEVWRRELRLPKMHDLHSASEAARRVSFAPAIRRFLQLVFERPPLAFQSLQFNYGTEQPIHQDTAYVIVDSPRELAASWIALEDIAPDSGELEYYVGSHRLDDFLWEGQFKSKPDAIGPDHPEHLRFLQHLHDASAAKGLKRQQFRPKRGDALIWHADLAHGGSKIVDKGRTRKSIVTHYCPSSASPGYYRHMRHSEKIACGEGCYYTYAIRA